MYYDKVYGLINFYFTMLYELKYFLKLLNDNNCNLLFGKHKTNIDLVKFLKKFKDLKIITR